MIVTRNETDQHHRFSAANQKPVQSFKGLFTIARYQVITKIKIRKLTRAANQLINEINGDETGLGGRRREFI